jgi:hypothetical protein
VGLSQSWFVDRPETPVKEPLEEKPGSSSKNCLDPEGCCKAVAISVCSTHWFHPAVAEVMALAPMGQVTVEGKG